MTSPISKGYFHVFHRHPHVLHIHKSPMFHHHNLHLNFAFVPHSCLTITICIQVLHLSLCIFFLCHNIMFVSLHVISTYPPLTTSMHLSIYIYRFHICISHNIIITNFITTIQQYSIQHHTTRKDVVEAKEA
jgi:hypothetical protein